MSTADRERWDAKYRDREGPGEPSLSLRGLAEHLPQRGRALDVAGGAGRNAIWLARRGLDVTLADVSPVGLALAERGAAAAGVSLHTCVVDFEQQPLPAGPFALIVDTFFLLRPLFGEFARALADGGRLVFIHPTRSNLSRHEKPPAAYLLDDGELPTLARGAGLRVVHYFEGWTADGRHEAQLVAEADRL